MALQKVSQPEPQIKSPAVSEYEGFCLEHEGEIMCCLAPMVLAPSWLLKISDSLFWCPEIEYILHSLPFSAANDDYVPVLNSQLTFNQATNVVDVQVFIVNNFLLEPRETIVGSLTLETVNVSVEIRPDMAQVEIMDDDSKCVDAFMSVHLSICLFVSVCLSVSSLCFWV